MHFLMSSSGGPPDGSHIEETIARCSRIAVPWAAYGAAVSECPDCVIALSRGMQLIDRTTIANREHSA
jgi:hypothetical protein